ncbi:hypothetical protein LENED_008800 [Lentinula edodes]|uniref:Uncharacterized protein n=1 Tax=Lentinula edodes TaxID=5353 RepID=A0A1Q3EHZ9_LENED|nr:hypothetical protein LENED_008800 [Lentinula edodes]
MGFCMHLHTIALPHLVSLSLEYVSRHCFYFPFQHLPRLRHLTLGNEGFCFFPKSSSEPSPALTFPKLRSLVISEASSFQQLCRTMTLINVLPHIKQVVLTQMPRLMFSYPLFAGQSSSGSQIAWTDLVRDIVYFIRRCPMIRSVTVRNAREHCYPSAELIGDRGRIDC